MITTTITRRKKPGTDFDIRYAIVKLENKQRTVIREGYLENPVMAWQWFNDFIILDLIQAEESIYLKNRTVPIYLGEDYKTRMLNNEFILRTIEKSVNHHLQYVKHTTHIGIVEKPWKIHDKSRLVKYHGPGMYLFDPALIMYNWHTLVWPLFLENYGMMQYNHPHQKNIIFALEITHIAPHLRKTIKNN